MINFYQEKDRVLKLRNDLTAILTDSMFKIKLLREDDDSVYTEVVFKKIINCELFGNAGTKLHLTQKIRYNRGGPYWSDEDTKDLLLIAKKFSAIEVK